MEELTKAEEQVMQYLWKLEKAFMKDIVAEFPEPKPAYTTISTVIRKLVDKGFIKFNTYSRVHEYFPAVSKRDYFQRIVKRFFGKPLIGFASHFAEMEKLSPTQLEEINKMIESKLKNNSDHDE
ncbi:MAG: BlaI/MecI/CopY family transcriptional regulator [Bacteroidia bacterium]|nr:BlaI/MecI/CopY family transcriptional regulator [Bacteroidia bacterium]